MNILATLFQFKHRNFLLSLLLVIGLFGVALFTPKSAYAETCGSGDLAGKGSCKASCATNLGEFGQPAAVCPATEPNCCYAQKDGETKGCTAKCHLSDGCSCPASCANAGGIVPKGTACGAKPTKPGTGGTSGVSTGVTSDSVFGPIDAPVGVSNFSTNPDEIGLLNFISMLIRIFTIICGIIVFFNFLYSGYTYIMSDGNAKAAETVRNRLTYSILGLVLIVSSYLIIALISLILFRDATYILNPTLTAPGAP